MPLLPNIDPDDPEDVVPPLEQHSPDVLLADLLLKRGLGQRLLVRLTKEARGAVIVIAVPSASYVRPIVSAVRRLVRSAEVIGVTQRKRRNSEIPDDSELVGLFASGRPVMAVSPDPKELLPGLLNRAADFRAEIVTPDAAMVRRVINAVTHGRARGLRDQDVGLWSFADIIAAIRPGSTAATCVARLKGPAFAPVPDDTTPRVEQLPLFGAAKPWSVEMLAEIERMRRGEISSRQIEPTILWGPPGTGKTLLAQALAKSAGLPFVATSVASWFATSDGALGGVLQAAESFFNSLRAAAPAIGLLDELDAIPARETLDQRAREWWTAVVTGVMLSVSAIRDSDSGVILLAATNFVDRIDGALKRPGRFGRHVEVRPPQSEVEVVALLRYHVGTAFTDNELRHAAGLAGAATPAAIEQWIGGARRLARAAGRDPAFADLVAQIAPADTRSRAELLNCAYHECGHAVAALKLGLGLESVSIVARGNQGGHTIVISQQLSPRLVDIEDRVVMTLAGRAADQIIGAGADSGSVSDLRQAARLLAAARASHGLRESLVHRGDTDAVEALLRVDPDLAGQVDGDLQRLMARAVEIVEARRGDIVRLAELLVTKRFIAGPEVLTLLSATPAGAPAAGEPEPIATTTLPGNGEIGSEPLADGEATDGTPLLAGTEG